MDYDKALCVYSFVRMITETFEDDLEIFSARLKAYLEHPGHARRKAPGRIFDIHIVFNTFDLERLNLA